MMQDVVVLVVFLSMLTAPCLAAMSVGVQADQDDYSEEPPWDT